MPLTLFNPAPGGDAMGVGSVGIGNPDVVFKRKFRWTFEVEGKSRQCPFAVPAYFCKISARPNISFEDTELNWLNDKMWIPGKASWETITVTYLDAAGTLSGPDAGANLGLYQWLLNVYDFAVPTDGNVNFTLKRMNSKRKAYSGEVTLRLWDGCGHELEQWKLLDAWPQAINFGDLDYSSSDTVDIELTLRYSMVQFTHKCPDNPYKHCCEECA